MILSKLSDKVVVGKETVIITSDQLGIIKKAREREGKVNIKTILHKLAGYDIAYRIRPIYDDGRIFNPPSPSDLIPSLIEAIKDGIQISLVFADEGVYTITLTDDLIEEFVSKSPREREIFMDLLDDSIENGFEASHWPPDTSYNNPYYKLLRSFGFNVQLHDYNKALHLRLYVTES